MLEGELLQAQLTAIDAWQAARHDRYAAALELLADETTRPAAAARLERLARRQHALLDRTDTPPSLRSRRRAGLRTVLVGHDVTDLLTPRGELDVLAHLLDVDAAVGVAVAEQPDAVVVGLDLPLLELAEAVADLTTFCPGARVCGYGSTPGTARMLAETGLVPLALPAGTPVELVVEALRGSRRAAG